MKPKTTAKNDFQLSLTKIPLHTLVSKEHELVKLSSVINWQSLEEHFGSFFEEKGRPAISTRLMIALHYLKYLDNLSDREVHATWVENPYWQFFSGMQFFEHEFPIDSSSMTRCRKRIAKQGAEELLKETIVAGLKLGIVKRVEIKNVNVDTTVQEKNIRFPTDTRLYQRGIASLVSMAKKKSLDLRQTYTRVSKRLLREQHKFANARRPTLAKRCTKKLKTILGRVIRDVERKLQNPTDTELALLNVCKKIHSQQKESKNKIYSVHESTTSCIAKGKVHKKFEFGSKVSIVSTNKSHFILGAMSFEGNPHDSKTLAPALEQVLSFGLDVQNIFADKGYRGHGIKEQKIHICSHIQKKKGLSFWKKIKRRSAIEPIIGHLKAEHGLNRNKLSGTLGDAMNLLLSCATFNLRKVLNRLKGQVLSFFMFIFFILPQEKRHHAAV